MTGGQPGVFVVSIDLEMAWGRIHHPGQQSADFSDERATVARLLALLGEYSISATWATVGHLFLDECGPVDGTKHPEVVRPEYTWASGDWFDSDPSSSVDEEPAWYAPDLVSQIATASPHQEIASHSFSHLIAGDPGCSRQAFESDLSAAIASARTRGIELSSFVYPRNSVGHVGALEELGFSAYRGPRVKPTGRGPIQGSLWRRIVDKMAPNSDSAVFPRREGGIVDVPQTYLFDPESRVANRFGAAVWTGLMRRRIRHATRTGSLFHLWFHPHNITANPRLAWPALESVLATIRGRIDDGDMVNLTMAQVAAGVLEGQHGT